VKRDDDLLRSLLLEIETSESEIFLISLHDQSPMEERRRKYHADLLCDAGLLLSSGRSNDVFRLTNDGHDYIAAIRSNKAWEKTKEGAAKVGGMTLGMMKDLALAYVKQEASEKLGIQL
jgi:hypothetical protein